MSLTTLAAIEQAGKMTAAEFKAIHESTGLSGAQLSEALEIHRSHISKYRLGRMRIPSGVSHAMRHVQSISEKNNAGV